MIVEDSSDTEDDEDGEEDMNDVCLYPLKTNSAISKMHHRNKNASQKHL